MKRTVYTMGGWTHHVHSDRAPNGAKNLAHGNNTLIGNVPSTLNFAQGHGVYNGAGCGACVHFPTCPKGVTASTDHCQWRPNRFKSAKAFQ